MLTGARAGARLDVAGAETFEQVFTRLLPNALRSAERILADKTLAEDAAAEAFARAHIAWNRIGRSDYRDAWIMRVTTNVAIDMARKRRKLLSVTLELAADHPQDRTDAEASRLALAAALASLPRRQREVVILRYLEGMPEEQVSRALGVSVGTVKKNAFRARATLRARLGEELAV